MSAFKPAQPEVTSTKRKQARIDGAGQLNIIRDFLSIEAWMALGALAQLALLALPIKPYYAAAPVLAYLVLSILNNSLMLLGVKENAYSADVLYGRTTALVPDEDGRFTKAGAKGSKISVFQLGVKSHHVLGPLAPGFSEIQTYATSMFEELAEQAEEYGFLGSEAYQQATASKTGSEILTLMYFRSNADVHRYAESPLHRKGWDWYTRFAREHKHLGIMHELYEIDAGKWETIYYNMEPNGMGVTRHLTYTPEGTKEWVSPLVDASKGRLSTTHGRLQ